MNLLAKSLAILSVLSTSGTLAFSQVPTPTRTPNPVIYQVDLNGDGGIDAKDLLLFMTGWQDRVFLNPTQTPTTTPIPTITPTEAPTPPSEINNQNIGTLATGSTISMIPGDDGSSQLGQKHSYTDHGDGTVTDNSTGLMWVKDPASAGVGAATYTWNAAIQVCEDLSYASHSDWRLPTIQELATLRDAGRFDQAIDPVFTCQPANYWSSTIFAYNAGSAWYVYFGNGYVHWNDQASGHYIRPVRVSPNSVNPNRFNDHGDGTVTDTETGLMWVKNPVAAGVGGVSTWNDAVQACENLAYAGHNDWRLPNINELSSLIDNSRNAPAIDPAITSLSSNYWSSTVYTHSTDYAWYVNFNYGYVHCFYQTNYYYIRPVRVSP